MGQRMSTTEAQKKSSSEDRSKILLSAVRGSIEPVDKTPFYTLGVVAVTGMLVLLLLIYVGMILLASGAFVLAFTSFPMGVFRLLAWFGAPIVVLFLIKPIFVPKAPEPTPKRIKRDAEPLLFAYVEQLCAAIGAPVPDSIRVNCEVNAAAQKRGGEFILHVGLPLAAGMNIRSFTEVLSHEFGHFTQDALYRANMPVRLINYWFYRVVMERDVLDVWLEGAADTSGLSWFAWPVMKLVAGTRWLLYCLMVISNAVSCFMLREAEYDADRHAARVVGSTVIVRSNRRMRELGVAYQIAIGDLQQFWNEGRLADNFPKLMVANFKHITDKVRRKLKQMQAAEQNTWFLTHPLDGDREASAAEENTPGILHLPPEFEKLPASVLFANFDRLCKFATLEMYREMVDPALDPDVLHSVEELLQRQQEEADAYKNLYRYFQGKVSPIRALPLPKLNYSAPKQPQRNLELVKIARERLMNSLESYQKCHKQYHKADSSLLDATRAIAVIQAGFRVDPVSFGMVHGSADEADRKSRDAKFELGELSNKLTPYEDANAKRLFAALQLLWVPKVAERIEGADKLRKSVERVMPVAQFTNGMLKDLVDFRTLYSGLMTLVRGWNDSTSQHESMLRACYNRIEAINTRLRIYYKELGDEMLYPFDHKKKGFLLREYILPSVPDQEDWQGTLIAADYVMERFIDVHVRALAKLATAAEQVELAVGFEQLPEIEEEKEEDEDKPAAEGEEGDGLVESEWNQKKNQTAVIAGLACGVVIIAGVLFAGTWLGLKMIAGKPAAVASNTISMPSEFNPPPQPPLGRQPTTSGNRPRTTTNSISPVRTTSRNSTTPQVPQTGSIDHAFIQWTKLPLAEARKRHPTVLKANSGLETTTAVTAPPGTELFKGPRASFILAKPQGTGPFPAVLVAHDGHSLTPDAYDGVVQQLVAKGFVAMIPNWRGENGNPGKVEWCCGEVEDAVAALGHLTSLPEVDKNRIVAYGKGIGGRLVLLLAANFRGLKGVYAANVSELTPTPTALASTGFRFPFDVNDDYETALRSPQVWSKQMTCPSVVHVRNGTRLIALKNPNTNFVSAGTYPTTHAVRTLTRWVDTNTNTTSSTSAGSPNPTPSSTPSKAWELAADPPVDVPELIRLKDINILVPKVGFSNGDVAFATYPSPIVAIGKVGYNQARVECWNLATRERVGLVQMAGSTYPDFAVSPDGQWLSIRQNKALEFHHSTEQGVHQTYELDAPRSLYFKHMVFADNKHLFIQYYKTLEFLEIGKAAPLLTIEMESAERCIAISPGSRYLAVVSLKGELTLFDPKTGFRLQKTTLPGLNLSRSDKAGLAFSRDGTQLAFSSDNRLVRLDVTNGKILSDVTIQSISGAPFRLSYKGPQLEWFPNGQWLLRSGYQVIDTAGQVLWTGPHSHGNYSNSHRVLDDDHIAVTLKINADRYLRAAPIPTKDFPKINTSP